VTVMTQTPRPAPPAPQSDAGALVNPWVGSRKVTRHYATSDPGTPDRAAFNVGVALGTWRLADLVVEALVTRARDLVAEAVDTCRGDRVIVTTVFDGIRAAVHVVSTQCTQDHPADLIDTGTTEVLREAAARWHATDTTSCPCTSMTLLGEDWPNLRLFLTTHRPIVAPH
jgi:hypothetical protein